MLKINLTRAEGAPDHLHNVNRAQPRRQRRHPAGYFTVAELARRGPLSLSGFYDEIKQKRLPAGLWRGRLLVVAESDFAEWRDSVVPLDPADAGNTSPGIKALAD